ncbi:MAG: PilW family protein [Pseudomonadales bacterium]|jgi:type IV pilus assembly protein PilW|nr:PilW family protein [Pseudomonadales bacterium]
MRRPQQGFTLIELLVSLALGLSVMALALGALLAGQRNFVLARELALLQESARFALDFLSAEIRQAGYTACSVTTPLQQDGAASWFLARPGLGGYDYDAGRNSFPMEFRAALRAGSDALALRYGEPASSGALENGQAVIRLASDCSALALGRWQVSAELDSLAGPLLNLNSAAYYVGSSNTASGVPALFRERLALNATTHTLYTVAEELVAGVDQLQLLYGVDDFGNDGYADHYLQAHAITDWRRVVSVQLSVRLRTIEPVYPSVRAYAPWPGEGSASDRYLRQSFTTTVALRNLR